MDKLGKLINTKPQETAQVTPSELPILETPLVMRLFKRFEMIWGQVWLNRYGDDDNFALLTNEWSVALGALSHQQIADAIEYCRDEYDWPPSISQFKSAAKPKAPAMAAYHASNNVKPDHSLKKLTSASGDKARKSAFEEMRSKLP